MNPPPIDRLLSWLDECTGETIWPVQYARQRGIPESWIDEIADAHESGFRDDRETIYHNEKVVNQFHGITDSDLAIKIAATMGLDTRQVRAASRGRIDLVRQIKELIEEG